MILRPEGLSIRDAGQAAVAVSSDMRSSDRPQSGHVLVNSPVVQRRLWKYYKQEAEILYPSVDLGRYLQGSDKGFYLHLCRSFRRSTDWTRS